MLSKGVGVSAALSEDPFLSSLLEQLHHYLQDSIVPLAAAMDSDPEVLFQGMQGLGDLGLFQLRIPTEWGGLAGSETSFCLVQEGLARVSGALAFLQVQHQSAIGMLLQSSNIQLQQTYLSQLGQGKVFWGVGFSHLRRAGQPLLQAVPVNGGYTLMGQVPWLTGAGCFQSVIVAAVLADGQVVFGRVPFQDQQTLSGRIQLSAPMQLMTMTATQTVSATFTNWFLPQDQVVSCQPPDWIDNTDLQNVLKPAWLAMGCAAAGLDEIARVLRHKPLDFIALALDQLTQELATCRQTILDSQQAIGEISSERLKQRLDLRAWSIDLAVRCAHAAISAAGGAANDLQHPAQRIYREALMFTVSGETPAIMAAMLHRLARLSPCSNSGS